MLKITEAQAKKRRDLIVVVQECGGGLRSFTLQYYHAKRCFYVYNPIQDIFIGEFPYDLSSFDIYTSYEEG
jgi:hypothetical protein